MIKKIFGIAAIFTTILIGCKHQVENPVINSTDTTGNNTGGNNSGGGSNR